MSPHVVFVVVVVVVEWEAPGRAVGAVLHGMSLVPVLVLVLLPWLWWGLLGKMRMR